MDELKELIVQIRKNKYYPIARSVLRGAFLYLFFAILFGLAADSIVSSFKTLKNVSNLPFPKAWQAALLIVFLVLILNSMCFLFAVFDAETRRRFLQHRWKNKEENPEESAKSERNLYFVEFITLCLCCLIFPVWQAYDSVLAMLPFSVQLPEILDRLILTVLFSAIAFFSVLHVGKKAEAHWLKKQTDAYKKRGYVANQNVERKGYTKFKFLLYCAGFFIGYSIVAGISVYLTVVGYSVLRGVWLILHEWVFFAVIGAIIVLIVGRKLLKRIKFYVRLLSLCKRYGFRIVEKNHPLLSLLLPQSLSARLASVVSPDSSVLYRFSLWRSIFRLSPLRLLFGTGEGKAAMMALLSPVLASGLLHVEHTHSLFLHFLLADGVVGVLLFLCFCVLSFKKSRQRGAIAAALALLFYGIFDDPLYAGQTEVIFWLSFGLL